MRAFRILPWLALAAAFSPLLVELAMHLRAEAWARYVLWFVAITPFAIASLGGQAPPQRVGFALLLVALMLQLVGIG